MTSHCPFCDEDMPYLTPKTSLGIEGWVMYCGRCGACGPWAETYAEAESLWNKRDTKRCNICKRICEDGGYVDNLGTRRCWKCQEDTKKCQCCGKPLPINNPVRSLIYNSVVCEDCFGKLCKPIENNLVESIYVRFRNAQIAKEEAGKENKNGNEIE